MSGVAWIEARLPSWEAIVVRLGGVHEATLPLLFVRRWPGVFLRRWLFLILDASGWLAGTAGVTDGDALALFDWLEVFCELTDGCRLEARWWKKETNVSGKKEKLPSRLAWDRDYSRIVQLRLVAADAASQKKEKHHASDNFVIELYGCLFKRAWLILYRIVPGENINRRPSLRWRTVLTSIVDSEHRYFLFWCWWQHRHWIVKM